MDINNGSWQEQAMSGQIPQNQSAPSFNPQTTLREEAVLKKSYGQGMMSGLMYFIFSTVLSSYFIFGLMFLFGAVMGYQSGGNISPDMYGNLFGIMSELADMSKPYVYIMSLAAYISAAGITLLMYYKRDMSDFAGFFKRPVASSGGHVLMWSVLILGVSQVSSIICYWIAYGLGIDKAAELNGVFSLGQGDLFTNITMVLYIAVAAPILEEIIFRGLLLKPLTQVSAGFGIIASAVAFGLIHGNIVQALNGFALGIILAAAAVRTGSLKMPIIMHVCVNSIALLQNYLAESGYTLVVNILAIAIIVGALVLAILFRREIFGVLKPVKIPLPLPQPENVQVTAPAPVENGQEIPQQPVYAPQVVYVNPAKGRCWKMLIRVPSFWVFTVIMVAVIGYTYLTALTVSAMN